MEIREQFEKLFEGKLSFEEATTLLCDLYEKGESATEIATAASVMRQHAIGLDVPSALHERMIDIVGTGGDKSGSFNISTTVSLVVASMGYVVAKHGNRSVTSRSGSTDLLEALGFCLDLDEQAKLTLLEEMGFCFFPATNHHPAMKHIMPVRKALSHRTIFNLLGPLTNPAGAKRYLLGVFDPSYVTRMAKALLALEVKRAFVVSSNDGMDEIGISGNTTFAYIEQGRMFEGEINPRQYGFALAPKEAILGGDAQENATITRQILSGELRGAKRDVVVLNSAFALFVAGECSLDEAIERVEVHLDSAKAYSHLEKMVQRSQALAKGSK